MPDVTDIDGCLTSTRGHLAALIDALARADVAAIEAAAPGLARAAGQLRTVNTSAAAPSVPSGAIDDICWMLERARRLGRPFGGASVAGAAPAYRPDGRVVRPLHRSATLEVTG